MKEYRLNIYIIKVKSVLFWTVQSYLGIEMAINPHNDGGDFTAAAMA